MREIVALPTISGVAPKASVSQTLPVGMTYDRIHIQYSGVTPSQITNVRLELNGRLITQYSSLQDLIEENTRFQREVKAGIATWHFVRDDMSSALYPELIEQRFFALGTNGLRTVQIRFDIAQEATAPVIECFAEKSAANVPGTLMKRRTFVYKLNNGRTEIDNLPRPTNASIMAIAIKAPGVEGVEFLVDNVKWRESVPLELHKHIMRQNGRTPIADEFYLDFCLEGDKYNTLKLDPAIRDMRLRVDCTQEIQAEVAVYYFDDFATSSF